MPRVTGREAIRAFFRQFFSMGLFTKLEHEMLEVWDLDEVLIYSAVAIYTRKDGSQLRSPLYEHGEVPRRPVLGLPDSHRHPCAARRMPG